MILELDCEKNDGRVTFIHPRGPVKSFYWPNGGDMYVGCHLLRYIPLKLNFPVATNGRSYTIDNQALNNITELLNYICFLP